MDADRQPVIIGVGQETWREQDTARTPVDALQAVATRAASDTGVAGALAAVDAVVHVPFIMNQVPELASAMPRNPGRALARRLGIEPRCYTADVGGNLPQQLLTAFAARLVRGEADVVLLCGVELLATFLGSVRAGNPFPSWASGCDDDAENLVTTPAMMAPTELAHGLFEPVNAYPLFESALRHAHGLDDAAHRARLGALVAGMSAVAATNPYAWRREVLSADAVLSTDGGNRLICHPYTKVMNAVIGVDQAAAVLLTTAGRARDLGVPRDRWIYLRGAASAHDTWFLGERAALHRSPALVAAARAAQEQAGVDLDGLAHFDLYSCFPSAVQVACDALGLAVDDPRGLTVTGGMSLFGGPGNNYSLHAIAAMVERLREGENELGLVSANGGYLTKHSVGIYAATPGARPWTPRDDAPLQAHVDGEAGPSLEDIGSGRFTIDACTVKYRGAAPDGAILIGRLGSGRRCVAVSDETAVMARIVAQDCVGLEGSVEHRDGRNHFVF